MFVMKEEQLLTWNDWYKNTVLWNKKNYLLFGNQKVIRSCYRTVPSAISEIFSEFLIFCNLSEIIVKYEKRGKYLPILHEATCGNYFIVKCLLKSNVAWVILIASSLLNIIHKKVEAKIASMNNLVIFLFVYFNSSMFTLFICFVLEVLFQKFDYAPTKLSISLRWHTL